jgi:HD-like signal output (HDOD) protein
LGDRIIKPRKLLKSGELPALEASLDRALDRVGMASQPEVVVHLLDLCNDKDAQLNDFAKVIKSDPAIAGRVMKLANSALFAQRVPVTSLERGCLVLGLERLKSISLGFHLSKAAAGVGNRDVSRRVWTHSVFRACFAAELARISAPKLVPEAFITGLMMDAGIPLMSAILGAPYDTLYDANPAPAALFASENDTLEYTHIDTLAALTRRWQFPERLTVPMMHRHARPGRSTRDDPGVRLHRVVHIAGVLELRENSSPADSNAGPVARLAALSSPMPAQESIPWATVEAALSLPREAIDQAIIRAAAEYDAALAIFAGIADRLGSPDEMVRRIQLALVQAADAMVEADIRHDSQAAPIRMTCSGHTIELVRASNGHAHAFLYDNSGRRLLTHEFTASKTTPASLLMSLGLSGTEPESLKRLAEGLSRLAA